MSIRGSTNPFLNILGEGSGQDWKVVRYPCEANTVPTPDITYADVEAGYLVKFNAGGTAVVPALAADDAVLAGIIVDKVDPGEPVPPTVGATPTVSVAIAGTFDENQIHYADYDPQSPEALSAAAKARLRDINIFLDPALPA